MPADEAASAGRPGQCGPRAAGDRPSARAPHPGRTAPIAA